MHNRVKNIYFNCPDAVQVCRRASESCIDEVTHIMAHKYYFLQFNFHHWTATRQHSIFCKFSEINASSGRRSKLSFVATAVGAVCWCGSQSCCVLQVYWWDYKEKKSIQSANRCIRLKVIDKLFFSGLWDLLFHTIFFNFWYCKDIC